MIQPYTTPAGFRDTPFIYVFDPWTLTSGYPFSTVGIYQVCTQQIFNQAVALQYGERFILRRVNPSFMVIGPNLVSDAPGGLKLRSARNIDRFSGARPIAASDFDGTGNIMNCSLPICPEEEYPERSQMNFDLWGTKLRYSALDATSFASPVPLSQLLFQGVRRYPYQSPDNRLLPGGWKQQPYVYPIDITIDWYYWQGGVEANGQSPPVQFTIPISDWDFELLDIRVLGDFYNPPPQDDPLATVELAQMTLFDWAQVALSSAPVNLHAINSADTGGFTGAGTPQPPGLGIGGTAGAGAQCPPLLYPNRSNITFSIVSLIQAGHMPTGGATITIQFVGRRRWPRT
jgi:hypothetical protein